MKVETFHELYVHHLQDMYSAETQLIEALPKVAKKATSPELTKAIEHHLDQTKNQLKRLETVFKELEEKPGGHECKAMKGLIQETDESLKEVKDPEAADANIIAMAQKVEHYEIASYGTLVTWSKMMGHTKQADLLSQTLNEEEETDKALTKLATSKINEAAQA